MKIPDERKLLSTIRNAVVGSEPAKKIFYGAFSPMFSQFIESGTEHDSYNGWAFNISFFIKTHAECELYHSAIQSSDSIWQHIPIGKDDCVYVIPNKGIIKIHLHSYLWNY